MKFRLPANIAFYLQASIILSFLAGSSVPTPMYSTYAAEWSFSPITTTIIFGVYALAVLAALLVFGRLSDHVGRRPVLLGAIAVQIITMVVFTYAHGVPDLLIARVIQGLSTGAAAGAIGAGMLDINRAKGTVANAVAPMLGTATGGLLSGILVQYAPFPMHLSYLVLLGVLVVQGIGVIAMRETASPERGALASLKPEIKMPRKVRRPMLVAIPALVAGWALAGFYGSVGPAVTRVVTGSASHVVGGVTLTVLAASGALTVLLLRNIGSRPIMIYGVAALGVGVGITLLGISWTSPVIFFLGAVIAGSGFGSAFQGAVRTVMPLAQPHQRAGVLSVIYVVSYLAMGLPAVIGGYLIVHAGGLLTTSREYGIAVIVLAALALVGMLRPARSADGGEIAVGVGGTSIGAPRAALVGASNAAVATPAGRVAVERSEMELVEAA